MELERNKCVESVKEASNLMTIKKAHYVLAGDRIDPICAQSK